MGVAFLEPPGVVLVKKHTRPCGPLMATGSWSTPRLNVALVIYNPRKAIQGMQRRLFCMQISILDLTYSTDSMGGNGPRPQIRGPRGGWGQMKEFSK